MTLESNELSAFTSWLATNNAQGYIGEVGWPNTQNADAPLWDGLAERWYTQADAANLWVSAWAATEWWRRDCSFSIYEESVPGTGLDSANHPAAVVERDLSRPGVVRGVALAGGDSNSPEVDPTSTFSNANPGAYGAQYHYDGQSSLNYLASRHVGSVRISFRWERIQRQLFGPLDPSELSELRAVVARAEAAGLEVILDLHNFGGYYLSQGGIGIRQTLGSPGLPSSALADVWGRLSSVFAHDAGIIGLGIMNEPAHMQAAGGIAPPQLWEGASQLAVDAIRGAGYHGVLLVSGYDWASASTWATNHPSAWIRDPAANIRYEAHQYFTVDTGANYTRSYAAENAAAYATMSSAAAMSPGNNSNAGPVPTGPPSADFVTGSNPTKTVTVPMPDQLPAAA